MRKVLYTTFPFLMPKVWRTQNKDYITYAYNSTLDCFVGSNNMIIGLDYAIKNFKPVKITKNF